MSRFEIQIENKVERKNNNRKHKTVYFYPDLWVKPSMNPFFSINVFIVFRLFFFPPLS